METQQDFSDLHIPTLELSSFAERTCGDVQSGRLVAPSTRDASCTICAAKWDAVRVPPLGAFQALVLVAVVRPPAGGAVLTAATV